MADLNNDNLVDIVLAGLEQNPSIFINLGNLKFKKYSLNIKGTRGVYSVDIDGDNNLDIVFTHAGNHPSLWKINGKQKDLYFKRTPNKKFIGIILGSDQGRSLFKKKLVALVEKYRLNSDVIFIDNLHEMPLAYKISDIVVSSSIEPEAFGRVSVEAQSMQKLIVASDIGGSNETIINDKTGFLFKAGDPNSLYQKLASIFDLSDDTIKYMGIEGRKNIIQKFNVEKMCFSTYSEYKKIIN